jgi:hypothetical protein
MDRHIGSAPALSFPRVHSALVALADSWTPAAAAAHQLADFLDTLFRRVTVAHVGMGTGMSGDTGGPKGTTIDAKPEACIVYVIFSAAYVRRNHVDG